MIFFHSSWWSNGLPCVFKSIFSGSLIGSFSFGTLYTFPSLSYAIGIGHPQYLCLEIPQSFNLKLVFLLPFFSFSINSIVLIIDWSGTFKLFKNFELNNTPEPVYASLVIVKSSFSFSGLTTVLKLILYLFAKSKSLWSWAGQPKTAPKP